MLNCSMLITSIKKSYIFQKYLHCPYFLKNYIQMLIIIKFPKLTYKQHYRAVFINNCRIAA